jgi:hypothetical protein
MGTPKIKLMIPKKSMRNSMLMSKHILILSLPLHQLTHRLVDPKKMTFSLTLAPLMELTEMN